MLRKKEKWQVLWKVFFLADIFLYSNEVEFIQYLLSTGKKKLASYLNFTYRHIDDVLSINKPAYENNLGQMYWAWDQRHDWEQHPCQLGRTVSCALPLTTNVTISTSLSQTFRSREAIFLFRQPMMFLSHSSYGIPGLTPLMNVLFLRQRDFRLNFSERDMSRNVWNRPSGSLRVDIKSPSPKCDMTFLDMTKYSDTLNW